MLKVLTAPALLILFILSGSTAFGEGVDKSIPIVPFIDPGVRKAELAELSRKDRRKYCEEGYSFIKPNFSVTAIISGPIARQNSNAQAAGNDLFKLVERWYFGAEGAAESIRKALKEGASIKAFTKLKPYRPKEYPGYNPMNEPIYQVANFLVPLAHAYVILKHEYPEDVRLLASVREWGDQLYKVTRSRKDDFKGKARGADRRVLIGQGWAHWGNATKNYKMITAAYRYYLQAIKTIGSKGNDKLWIRVHPNRRMNMANMTYGAAMSTAFALVRSGASDVYDLKPGGGTLVKGISWLWNKLTKTQDYELFNNRSPGSRSVAWAELFIHEFPNHATSARMRAWYAPRTRGSYGYTSGGGPTTCLYREIP